MSAIWVRLKSATLNPWLIIIISTIWWALGGVPHFQTQIPFCLVIRPSLLYPYCIIIWLVVDLPLWKIWVRQLGLLFPTEWKVIKLHGSKPPTSHYIPMFGWLNLHYIPVISPWWFKSPSKCCISRRLKATFQKKRLAMFPSKMTFRYI